MNRRKIIHVDMDAFYAAIEVRDNPNLKDKPIAVGGDPTKRGVIMTANYEARKYGVKSAVASARAIILCPNLTIITPNMEKYKKESKKIQEIFSRFTEKIEPLALDEAYLDVTDSKDCNGSATLIAEEIRKQIFKETDLTASAGIAPNKFLAKVASDMNKPNGQYIIPPEQVENFVKTLSVKRIPGVGKVTSQKLAELGVTACKDLQGFPEDILIKHFGKFGVALLGYCRGIDKREVVSGRERKSLSVEKTFDKDIEGVDSCVEILPVLYKEFNSRLKRYQEKAHRDIKSIHIKIKFSDFTTTTVEKGCADYEMNNFVQLFREGYERKDMPIRLVGLGVKFREAKALSNSTSEESSSQLTLII